MALKKKFQKKSVNGLKKGIAPQSTKVNQKLVSQKPPAEPKQKVQSVKKGGNCPVSKMDTGSDDDSSEDMNEEDLKKFLEETDESDESGDDGYLDEEAEEASEEEDDSDDEPSTKIASLKRERDDEDSDEDDEDNETSAKIALLKRVKADVESEEDSDVGFSQPTIKKRPIGDVDSEEENDEEEVIPKKSKPDNVQDKRQKKQKQDESSKNRLYLNDTPKVLDPIIRKSIEEKLTMRYKSTVRLVHIPSKCSSAILKKLAPDMVSCRIPWNTITHRSRGVAYVEFADVETAESCRDKLHKTKIERQVLFADINKEISVSADDFNCHRLMLSNLHWKTTKKEISSVFTKSSSVDFPPNFHKESDKRMPGVAYVTYDNINDAIEAFDMHHGCTVRGQVVSVIFQKKQIKDEVKDQTKLLVFGVKKDNTEKDLRALFPQATSISIFIAKGMACLEYANSEECIQDKTNAKKGTLSGKPIKVFFGSSNHKSNPDAQKAKPTQVQQTKKPTGPVDKSSLFVKNLDKKTILDEVKTIFPNAVDVDLPLKPGGCRGYAIVKFSDEKSAEDALESNKDRTHRGRVINVCHALIRPSRLAAGAEGGDSKPGEKRPFTKKSGKFEKGGKKAKFTKQSQEAPDGKNNKPTGKQKSGNHVHKNKGKAVETMDTD